jgi:DNA modification methylase
MLIHADARHLPLRDGCVQCCVTSPPYFGLRDYGTATWDGGDPECDHRNETAHQKQGASSQRSGRANVDAQRNENFRNVCVKCGAVRIDNQIGLEPTPDAYVATLVAVFREVRRVLKDDGTLWLNLGDSYCSTDKWGGGKSGNSGKHTRDGDNVPSWAVRARKPSIEGVKPKDLLGIPWRVAFALQDDGWYLRSDIVWHKPNPMPESVTDRPTKSHEYLFLLAKSERYCYDAEAIKEPSTDRASGNKQRDIPSADDGRGIPNDHLGRGIPWQADGTGRNKRSVWTINPQPFSGSHFAVMPEALVQPCILAGCPEGGLVLDPFIGSGTVGVVAERLGRRWVGTDLSYHDIAKGRTAQRGLFV